jgi:two-component system, OmpR family, KDP operon response regulator KdpE
VNSTPVALIIDDEIQLRRLLRLALEGQGWRVFEAETGPLGLSEAAVRQPSIWRRAPCDVTELRSI